MKTAKSIDSNSDSHKITKSMYTVQPKTKDELEKIIEDTIKEKGSNCDLNFIDTSLITDMSRLFMGSDFNGIISKWNVSNVRDMSGMFSENIYFEGDLSDWDVSNVEDMSTMFYATSFKGNLSKWNVSNVRYMGYMFAESEFNSDIHEWDVSNVINMDHMFYRSAFDKDVSEWDVSYGVCMDYMFKDSELEKTGTLPEWY